MSSLKRTFLFTSLSLLRAAREFSSAVITRMQEERLNQTAGSLTFATILAIVPLATLALALFTVFPAFDVLRKALENYFIESLMPKQVASVVTQYVNLFAKKASGISVMGAGFLLLSATVIFLTIERTLNQIWQHTPPQRLHTWRGWRTLLKTWGKKLGLYWAGVVFLPIIVGIIFYVIHHLSALTRGVVPSLSDALHLLQGWLPIVLYGGTWAALFRYLPSDEGQNPVQWRDAITGAAVAAVLLAVLKWGFTIYLSKYANFKELYGAFSVIPVLLIWIYLVWLVTLLGAVVAAVLGKARVKLTVGAGL